MPLTFNFFSDAIIAYKIWYTAGTKNSKLELTHILMKYL